MKNSVEVIDVSKKSRIVSIVALIGPFVLGMLFGADTKEEVAFFGILSIASFWLSSYILEKGKIVLQVGSFLDKDKRFYILNNGKKIDSLRIRSEEDASEKDIFKRFEEFLRKNNLKQYKKIYLMGSDSKEDIDIVRNTLSR